VIILSGLLLLAIISFEFYKFGYKVRRNESLLINPVHRQFKFSTPLPNGLIFLGRAGNNIDESVLRDGYYEPEVVKTLQFLAKHLKNSAIQDSNEQNKEIVFLDIGANVGVYTLAMSTEVDRIIAVEPYPPVLDRLYAQIKKNDLNNVEVLEVGFGNKKEKLVFQAPPDYYVGMGTFSLEKSKEHQVLQNPAKSNEVLSLKLPLERGDDLLKGITVDMIKLDTEGYERFALEGLNEVLTRSRPAIVMELNHNNDGGFATEEQLRDVLPEHYSILFYNYYQKKICLAPLSQNWKQAHRLFIIPNELSAFADSIVKPNCLSTIAEITYPFFHQLRGIKEVDIPETKN